ncbi:uncharacterized protein LOC106177695 [Lingula anatina]|uniref:Uncharacterized protein LOC106177695 n=1 Tax=Lingula anatina TaxID=7574 RepID=A0A1S3K0C4_LINAN|nr:uncharacterized protein LOC106177695 [Lingula anatina]|eukprot:XP_013415997.1 uncharacterized protein LOC106177695 [Lingula anatina]
MTPRYPQRLDSGLLLLQSSDQDSTVTPAARYRSTRLLRYSSAHDPAVIPAAYDSAPIDAWIDELVPYSETVLATPNDSDKSYEELLLKCMFEKDAPRASISPYNGSALDWPGFAELFYEEVHKQPYFKDTRRMWLLQSSVTGQAKQHIAGYGIDGAAYAIALKALKHRFGHRSLVARAFLERVTDGPTIKDRDRVQLESFYKDVYETVQPRSRKASSFHTTRPVPEERKPVDHPFSKTQSLRPSSQFTCVVCGCLHALYKCELYLAMTIKKRFECVNSHRLCRNCLRPGHIASDCTSPGHCRADNCNKRHHTTLHDVPQEVYHPRSTCVSSSAVQAEVQAPSATEKAQPKRSFATQNPNSEVYLQVVPVIVTSPTGEKINTSALLDCGSQLTMIRRDLASQLNLSGPMEILQMGTVTRAEDCQRAQLVSFTICSAIEDDDASFPVQQAWVVDKLNIPPQRSVKVNNLPHLRDLKDVLPDCPDIGLLIGGDVPDIMVQTDIRRGPPGTPIAIKTGLGWSFLGRLADPTTKQHRLHVLHADRGDADQLEKIFTTESFGCKFEDNAATSVDDRHAQSQFDQKTSYKSGRYSVLMLWKTKIQFYPQTT